MFVANCGAAVSSHVPVIIIGGSLNGLGVARSLAGEGMPIYVVDHTRLCVSGWSRYCTFVRTASFEGPDLIRTLLRLRSKLAERGVLIMTDDRAVESVSRFRENLEDAFLVNLPSKYTVERLLDKSLFQRFAEEEGLAVPRTVLLRAERELPLLDGLAMPVVVKPTEKKYVLNAGAIRAERADSREEARALAREILELGAGVIAQEWIEGADTDLFFTLFSCGSNGEVNAIFSGRKIVCHPPAVGNTAVCVAAEEEAPILEILTREFIEISGFQGLGSVEFKRDARTGHFMIIEPTVGRTDWQEEIATLCGVNIPLAEYRAVIGRPIKEPRPSPEPVAWQASRRHRPRPGLLPSGTRIQGGHYRPDDPWPAFFHYGYERFAGRALRLVKRALKGESLHASH